MYQVLTSNALLNRYETKLMEKIFYKLTAFYYNLAIIMTSSV